MITHKKIYAYALPREEYEESQWGIEVGDIRTRAAPAPRMHHPYGWLTVNDRASRKMYICLRIYFH